MTHTANPPVATIRARVHQSALKRVTKFWASRPIEILLEALQNSRRAGATRVHVTVEALTKGAGRAPEPSEPRLAVTVTDDGAGIEDPAVLLSFGENGWSDDLVAREDAAGMGILSLAHRGCRISSPHARRRQVGRAGPWTSHQSTSRAGATPWSGATTARPIHPARPYGSRLPSPPT